MFLHVHDPAHAHGKVPPHDSHDYKDPMEHTTHHARLEQRLLTPKEAAAYLNIGERTLWTITAEGTIPSIKLGRSVRYDRNDLDAFICGRRRTGKGS